MADDEGNSPSLELCLDKEPGACGSVTWDMRRKEFQSSPGRASLYSTE